MNVSIGTLEESAWCSAFVYDWTYCRWYVYGNSFESFLVAVVNPNKEALESWAEGNGISGDFEALCENPKAKEYILGELSKTGKEKKVILLHCFFVLLFFLMIFTAYSSTQPNFLFIFVQLKGFEFIRAVHLDPVPFDMERDLITPNIQKEAAAVAQVLPGIAHPIIIVSSICCLHPP